MGNGNFELNTSRLEETNEAANSGKAIHSHGFIDGFQVQRKIRATYDFAKHGGALGDIGLGIIIPRNAVIKKGWIDVLVPPTSGGSATVALKLQSAADVLAATAIASVTGRLDTKQTGTAATMIKTTDDAELKVTVAVDTLLTGKFIVYLDYDISDPV